MIMMCRPMYSPSATQEEDAQHGASYETPDGNTDNYSDHNSWKEETITAKREQNAIAEFQFFRLQSDGDVISKMQYILTILM